MKFIIIPNLNIGLMIGELLSFLEGWVEPVQGMSKVSLRH